jgi:acylphosphatase
LITTESVDAPAAKKKKKVSSFVKKRKDVGIEIKVKGDDGEVTSYQEEEFEEKPKATKKKSKI